MIMMFDYELDRSLFLYLKVSLDTGFHRIILITVTKMSDCCLTYTSNNCVNSILYRTENTLAESCFS